MTTEYWEYDMYDTYVTCGLCGEDNNGNHKDWNEGDVLECEQCGKESILGVDYIQEEI